ncbi:MAG: Coenzyme F420:L-glutamate ligase [Syntrophaceae bacterium PtaU1.Bin231]|nr:MAG: Coenzyme F420:L-glutamate ligase [Syntrophaceae bacterium PtaU1.Bin231]
MDFQELLKKRRSIRDFRNEEVPLPVLQEILRDTCLAPTAGNGQPCRFIVIRDRGLMKRLSDDSKKSLLADIARSPDSPLKKYEAALKDEGFNVFYNAPCLVLITGPKGIHSLEVDCALTAAYFMFSAVSRGLGTCWIALGAHIRNRELLAGIGVPESCRIVAPIVVGYPAGIPKASERHAPDIVKIV